MLLKIIRTVQDLGTTGNKLKAVLYMAWLWAIVGIYMVKAFEFIFRMILFIPNTLLNPLEHILPNVTTTEGNEVQIISAINDKGQNIKSKLILFMTMYYKKNIAFDKKGFNMKKLSKFISTDMIFISYKLLNENFDIEKLYELVANYNSEKNKSYTTDLSGKSTELFFHNLSFDDNSDDNSDLDNDLDFMDGLDSD